LSEATMSMNEALARLAELRRYMEAIQAQIDQATQELEEIRSSTNAISELKRRPDSELLMPTDRRGHVLFKVKAVDPSKVLTHVGLEYFAEVDIEKAVEILTIKEKEVKEVLGTLQQELNKVASAYKQLQDAVNAALARARGKAGAGQ